jgi:prepilin-type N-terminal cleavage/methylation domain-containing protein
MKPMTRSRSGFDSRFVLPPGSHGFTLIEVLVVVAILALLVAILLPSLARAKEQSRRAICASRLHNIGMGVHAYASPNRGHIIECTGRDGPTTINLKLLPQYARDPWDYVDWHHAAKSVYIDRTTWECPNREDQYFYEGPADIRAALKAQGYLVNENDSQIAAHWSHFCLGFQYFGGLARWNNLVAGVNVISASPKKIEDKPGWALAADSNIKVDGVWGGGRTAAWGKIPPHPAPSGRPAGGNILTLDAAVAWTPFNKMLNISTWDSDRACFWWQSDLGDLARAITPDQRDRMGARYY